MRRAQRAKLVAEFKSLITNPKGWRAYDRGEYIAMTKGAITVCFPETNYATVKALENVGTVRRGDEVQLVKVGSRLVHYTFNGKNYKTTKALFDKSFNWYEKTYHHMYSGVFQHRHVIFDAGYRKTFKNPNDVVAFLTKRVHDYATDLEKSVAEFKPSTGRKL
jgi:hypothetical protein